MELNIIAFAHNGFVEKFGIPRQPKQDSSIETRIVFEPDYRMPEALRGIEDFSHLWLIWGFNANTKTDWSPTVRPPRLGGNTRMGVFATRSPIRPNPLGLSSVKLLRVEHTRSGTELVVSGADILDGTPIYDIKPYIAYSDSHPEAVSGFVDQVEHRLLSVQGLEQAMAEAAGQRLVTAQQWTELLEQDPRPAYQDDPERIYHLAFGGEEVSFRVRDKQIFVLKVQKIRKK